MEIRGFHDFGVPEWLKIDSEEKRLGPAQSRERVKLVKREDFMSVAKGARS